MENWVVAYPAAWRVDSNLIAFHTSVIESAFYSFFPLPIQHMQNFASYRLGELCCINQAVSRKRSTAQVDGAGCFARQVAAHAAPAEHAAAHHFCH